MRRQLRIGATKEKVFVSLRLCESWAKAGPGHVHATRPRRVPSTRLGHFHLLLPPSQVSCGGLLEKEPHLSYPSARPLHSVIYLVFLL
jgi:hypothetical protein